MDYKNKLIEFFGEVPTFHDSYITSMYLNDKILELNIKTKVSKVLHSEKLYNKYSFINTSFVFSGATITQISADTAGIIINKLKFIKQEHNNVCNINGVLGSLEIIFLEVLKIEITTVEILQ